MATASTVIGAAIGAALGGAIWAAITHFTGYEVGYVAVGVGALAGLGAVTASRGEASKNAGIIAAVFAVLAILGAKYVVVYAIMQQMDSEVYDAGTNIKLTDEDVKESLARDFISAEEAAGRKVVWPSRVDEESAEWPGEYPKAVVAETERQWKALSPTERTARHDAIQKEINDMLAEFSKLQRPSPWDAYVSVFDLFDLLWIGLAVAAAYRVGAKDQA